MPNTGWMKLIVRSRQRSVSFSVYRKSKLVDRDVLLRKTRGKLCNFIVSFQGRPARSMHGNDVLAVLPKVFMRSLIFQNFVIAVEMERERLQTALLLCPLKSIINEQISEARNMGFLASSLVD